MTAPGPQGRNLFDIVRRHAVTRPESPALAGLGHSWTYAELARQAENVAGALAAICPAGKARVAVVANNHPLTCVTYLAASRAGITVSLLNSLFKAHELAVVLAKLKPHVLIFDEQHREVVAAAIAEAGVEPVLATLERSAEPALPSVDEWTEATPFSGPGPLDGDCAEISWTSGTTSAPKGVMLTHDTVIFRAECEIDLFGLVQADAASVITPLFHQSGIRNTVVVMWVCGGHAVVLPRFDVSTFWSDMVRYQVTYLCMVETILLMLERNAPCAKESENVLRVVLAASEPSVVARCEERFGFRVVQVWGMTETGVSTGVPRSVPMEKVRELRTRIKGAFLAGWPIAEETRLFLFADGEVVSGDGATGEIRIASRLVFSQYYEDPEATDKAFDGRWFKTGDLAAYGPDEVLYFVDRLKDVIRRGGENIASKQVEEVLLGCPGVRQAVVVPVPDPLFMQEVKAVIVPERDLEVEVIWSWCEERLANYKVPRYIEFRDTLPVTGSGRVQKHLLAGVKTGEGRLHDRRAAKVLA